MLLLRKSVTPLLPIVERARLISSGHTTTVEVGQGGRLIIDMAKAAAEVKVTTKWIEKCSLAVFRVPAGADGPPVDERGTNEPSLTLSVNMAQTKLTLAHDPERAEDGWEGKYLVEAVVPELFSVDLRVLQGRVSVGKKLKGDCQIQLDTGDITVGTVRGETIRLSTGSGSVDVDELEGNVDITAIGDVRARLVNGAKVAIDTAGNGEPSVIVGALYSSGARITSAGNVGVSSCHGRIAVHTAGAAGSIDLCSVNGIAQVATGIGGATIHMDVLEEGTASSIRSDGGDVKVTLSRQVDADVEIGADSVELPSVFEGEAEGGRAMGRIHCAAAETSRATPYGSMSSNSGDAGGGKIDLVGARGQSLRQYFPSDAATNSKIPKVSISAKGGSVGVEILSWADNIARKFLAREAKPGRGGGGADREGERVRTPP